MNMNGWGLSFLRARAKMILIGSLLVCGGLPVFSATVAENIKALKATDPAARRQAVEDLVKAGPDALPELLAAATNRRLLVRFGGDHADAGHQSRFKGPNPGPSILS